MTEPVTQLPGPYDASKALSLSLGLASPLWLAFAGAAMAGSAFWWMSRWTRPDNLEAMLTLPTPAPAPEVAPSAAALTAPVAEAVQTAVAETAAVVEPAVDIATTAAETAMEAVATETAAMLEGLADVDPVVDAAPAVEAAAAAVETAADDLTKLVGIGPKLAASLAELGVTSFKQIAGWTADDLANFDAALSLKGRAARDAWVAQARRLADA